MSERYSRLFYLQNPLYLEGAPVIIQAGAILKDNEKQKLIAQLKLQSISEKAIKAATVQITLLDTAERELGGAVVYQYLDLNISRDSDFGEQTPVYLDSAAARSFNVCVTEVVFDDNSIWSAEAAAWAELPKPEPLNSALSGELLIQYRLDNGEGCQAVPKNIRDLWYCVCGACNHDTEELCHVCTRPHSQCDEEFDLPKLKAEVSARMAAEHEQAVKKQKEEEAKRAAEAAEAAELAKRKAEAAEKRRKIIKILAAVAAAAVAACVVVFVIVPKARLNAELKAKYDEAAALYDAGEYQEAKGKFSELDGYKDSADRAAEAVNAEKYARAEELLAAGDYNGAIATFEALGSYKDSADRAAAAAEAKEAAEAEEKAAAYEAAVAMQENGETAKAAIAFGKLGDYQDAKERSMALWDKTAVRETISAGRYHTVGLKSDGSVVFIGNDDYGQQNIQSRKNVIAVSAGAVHTLALKSDGSVAASGDNWYGQTDVSAWSENVVAVAAGGWHSVGLKSDGTVIAVGDKDYGKCNISDWTDIVAVSAGLENTAGLKSDSTVVAVGDNSYKQCEVSNWKDIVAVSVGDCFIIGLKSDGRVVSAGYNGDGECDTSQWEDIIAVSAGQGHTVGLKSDGTVVAVGKNDYGQCNVSDWTDIVAVCAGFEHTVGLKSDGTVVAVGNNEYGQCDVSDWTDIKLPE